MKKQAKLFKIKKSIIQSVKFIEIEGANWPWHRKHR